MTQASLAVFISGRGSNMQAIYAACQAKRLDARIDLVLSDRADAPGIVWAHAQGIQTITEQRSSYQSRAEHEKSLLDAVNQCQAKWLILAGFMRVLRAEFIEQCPCPIINIHPSRLPLYKGLNTHQRALDAGDSHHGASVHIVTAELDGGPVLAQSLVKIETGDSAERLEAKVLATEHRLYEFAIHQLLNGSIQYLDGSLQSTISCENLPLQLE